MSSISFINTSMSVSIRAGSSKPFMAITMVLAVKGAFNFLNSFFSTPSLIIWVSVSVSFLS